MVRASASGWRLGRIQGLVLGGLLIAGLLAIASAGAAQNPAKAPPKADPAKSDPAKPDPAKPETPKIKRVIVAKTPDVLEMTKFINDKLEAGWKANSITPSAEVHDLDFMRRASLDVIGRIPSMEEITVYLKDPADKRRSLLIERLLSNEDYARHWANMWTNWLLGRAGTFGKGEYHDKLDVWMEDLFAQNKHYDEIVKLLIAAKPGENTKDASVNFILAHVGEQIRDPKLVAEEGHFEMVPLTSRITRLFLGIQIQCAQCHDHPFLSSLKQERFWGVNAFLRQVNRKGTLAMARNQTPGPLTLDDDTSVNTEALGFYEKRNGVKLNEKAVFLPSGPEKKARKLSIDPKTKQDVQGVQRRIELADAVVDHEQFSKALVNRYWGTFFGRGFVNPIDDFNDNNKPSDPELLDQLATNFKHYNYDLKALIRWICNSEAYQLSCVANKTNDKPEQEALFSRVMFKTMTPEQLYESLMVATNKSAVQTKQEKKDGRGTWLDNLISNFGDDEGNEVNFNGTVVQALMMMNGQNINDAITLKDKGTVAIIIAGSKSEDDAIGRLFLASLTREPTKNEIKIIKERFPLASKEHQAKDVKDAHARYQDLFWALLNSNEFMLNH